MYTEFAFIDADTDIRTKTIILNFTMDIDPDTVSDSNIEIFERKSRNDVLCSLELQHKRIIITFKEWPIPNYDYILKVQNLKSITGDLLDAGIKRAISFESDLLSTINITYPANDEEIKDLKLEWIENAADNKIINSYYLEIATDNAFNNISLVTNVLNRQSIDLKALTDGQYYARVRVQNDNGYGLWSDLVTFIVTDNPGKMDKVYDNGEEPIFVQDLKIISKTEDGETPDHFIIEFDGEIDPDSIDDILLFRRSI